MPLNTTETQLLALQLLSPQANIFQPIADAIEATLGVKSFFGAKYLAGNQAPPRYVWVPTNGEVDGPSGHVGDAPRSLADVAMTFEVHCWGQSFDVSWTLLCQLVTAVREKCTANYDLGTIDATPPEEPMNGWILTVPIAITLPLYETDFDQVAKYIKAQATIVRIDDSQGVDPDGVLTAPLK